MSFILGFIAGEGSFQLNARKNGKYIEVIPKFSIYLKDNDEKLLREIHSVIGVGSVTLTKNGHVQLQARSKEDLSTIISFIDGSYDKFWKNSNKKEKYETWKEIVHIYLDGETTKEQKVKMLEKGKKMKGDGRKRDTKIDKHIKHIKEVEMQ